MRDPWQELRGGIPPTKGEQSSVDKRGGKRDSNRGAWRAQSERQVEGGAADGGGVAEGGGAAEAWSDLEIPEERDMHFFVRSMAELRGCYGNE